MLSFDSWGGSLFVLCLDQLAEIENKRISGGSRESAGKAPKDKRRDVRQPIAPVQTGASVEAGGAGRTQKRLEMAGTLSGSSVWEAEAKRRS